MKLYDLLKEYGLFTSDIRQRLGRNQILVNGEPQKGDHDLGNITQVIDQGFFLSRLYKIPNYRKLSSQLLLFGIENLMSSSSNIENDLTDFLSRYKMIQISRDAIIFVKIGKKETSEILFHLEGSDATKRIVEKAEQKNDIDLVNKLKSDKMKLEAQLSNKGFINNAPEFKIDAVKRRLGNINNKLSELGVS